MSEVADYQDPDHDPRLQRVFLLSDMHDAFVDNIDKVAVGAIRSVGMVALLKGRVDPAVIDDEVFDEKTMLTLIHLRVPHTSFNLVNIRATDDSALYGYNIRTQVSDLILDGLSEEDAIEDEWRRNRIGRTRFDSGWAENSLAMLTQNPLLLGILPISVQ